MTTLLTPREVDLLFRYPAGRAARLALAGKLPFVRLPGGEIRFAEAIILTILEELPGQNESATRVGNRKAVPHGR